MKGNTSWKDRIFCQFLTFQIKSREREKFGDTRVMRKDVCDHVTQLLNYKMEDKLREPADEPRKVWWYEDTVIEWIE